VTETLDHHKKLTDTEEELWKGIIKLPKDSCMFEGEIIKGYGKGGTILSLPTDVLCYMRIANVLPSSDSNKKEVIQ